MNYISSLLILLVSSQLLYSQGSCELFLNEEKLEGKCKNSYFAFFEIPMKETLLDSATLFNQLPISGNVTYRNNNQFEVRFELTNRAGFPQILFKSRSGWFTMDNLIISPNSMKFNIDHDPDVPIAKSDLMIIRKTKELLGNEDSWHKNDDRNCDDDIQDNSYSLFCALKTASVAVDGEYNHRNAIMQKIRHTIVEMYPNKKWSHRLQDFNNMRETDFNVLIDLLNRVESEVINELEQKK